MRRPLRALCASLALALAGCAAPPWLEGGEDAVAEATEIERAWRAFADAVRDSRAILDGPNVPEGSLHRAEGYRYLTRLINLGFANHLHRADPAFPILGRLDVMSEFGGPNPDNLYQSAALDGDSSYRLRGKRGTVNYVEFTLGIGFPGMGESEVVARIDTEELRIAPDGSFELLIAPAGTPGAVLPMRPGRRHRLMVRQVFYNWEHERRAEFTLTRVGSEGRAPDNLTEAEMAERIRGLARFVEVQSRMWVDFVDRIKLGLPHNTLPPTRPPSGELLGSRSFFSIGYFRIGPGQALIVEIPAYEAEYMGFQITNYWFEAMDYANRSTSLNGYQAPPDGDGVTRLVLADRDPGLGNWIDTAGQGEGIMMLRFALAETVPSAKTRLVAFDEVAGALPADTPRVSAEQRRSQLAIRQRHVARRYFP